MINPGNLKNNDNKHIDLSMHKSLCIYRDSEKLCASPHFVILELVKFIEETYDFSIA